MFPASLISDLAKIQSVLRERPAAGSTKGRRGRHQWVGGAAPQGGAAPGEEEEGAQGRGRCRGRRPQEGGGGSCGGVLGFAPPMLAGHPNGPLGPTAAPSWASWLPPLAHKASSWACWPKAQAQIRKNRRNAEFFSFKNSNSNRKLSKRK